MPGPVHDLHIQNRIPVYVRLTVIHISNHAEGPDSYSAVIPGAAQRRAAIQGSLFNVSGISTFAGMAECFFPVAC
jgi:hypothetical protein